MVISRQLPELKPINSCKEDVLSLGSANIHLMNDVNLLSSNMLASSDHLLQLKNLEQLRKQHLQIQQQQHQLTSSASISPNSIILPKENVLSYEADLDVEKIETCDNESATDLSSRPNTGIQESDLQIVDPATEVGVAEHEATKVVSRHEESFTDLGLQSLSNDKVEPMETSEDVTSIQESEPIKIPVTQSNSPLSVSPQDIQNRSSSGIYSIHQPQVSSPPQPEATIQTRSKARDHPVRRANRRRSTRYVAEYCDHPDDDCQSVRNQPPPADDAEVEVLRGGSDEYDDDDSHVPGIQAVVQNFIDGELTEEKINKTSRQRNGNLDNNSPAEIGGKMVSGSGGSVFTTAESVENTISKTNFCSVPSEQSVTSNGVVNTFDPTTENDDEVVEVSQHYNMSSGNVSKPFLQRTTQSVEILPTSSSSTRNGSDPPLPKLKLRINNGPMTVETVEPCGIGSS